MCFENLNMAVDMSRAIFSLLLFGIALQGLEAMTGIHFAEVEAAVGQNISLPCILNETFDTRIFQIEWRKKPSSKLVVYHVDGGPHYFGHDIKFQTKMGEDKLMGSYLQLFRVQVNDSGTYVCDLTTYPSGSMSREMRLEVKDEKVTCDKDSALELYVGDNVTVQCEARLYPQALYKWFKNETVVSETSTLEVVLMDESQAGVYTLTVSTGHKTLRMSFHVTLLTPTESPSTELTSQNANHSSTGVYVPTAGPAEANSTSETVQSVSSSVPSTQATTENTYATSEPRDESFTARPIRSSSATTTLGLETHRGSTEGAGNVTEDADHRHTASSVALEPEADAPDGQTRTTANLPTSRLTTEDQTVVIVETSGSMSRYGWLVIVLSLVAFVVFAVLYRRHVVQKRLDCPPPFKPPPPPQKYNALKPQQIPMHSSCTWEGQLGGP